MRHGPPLFDVLARWRLTSVVLVIYALVSMAGGLIALDGDTGGWWAVTGASVAATAVTLVLLLASTAAIVRIRRTHLMGLWFIPVALGVGAVRAGVLLVTASLFGIPISSEPAGLVVNSALSAVIWLGLSGILAGSAGLYRERYRALVRTAALSVDGTDLDRIPVVERMRTSLQVAVAAAAHEPTPDQWARASAAIRQEIETTLRPLSHRLWFGAADEEPHARWSRVLRDAMASFRPPVRAVAGMWLVASLLGGVGLFGWKVGVATSLLSTALLAVTLVVGRLLMQNRVSVTLGVVVALVASLVPVIVTDALLSVVGVTSSLTQRWTLIPLLWAAIAGLVVLTGAVALVASDRRVVLDVAASAPVGTDRLLSSYLHNGLQSELIGMAMQLEGAARADDPDVARDALERVQSLLSRSLSEDLAAFHEEPIARADRVAQAWAGICAVTFTLPAGVRSDPLLAEAVTAAEELISNAVRHTGATRIEVRVDDCAPGGLLVVCRSDTPGGAASGSGLGSHLLASVSEIAPEVLQDEQGTTYSVRIRASRRA